MTAIFVLKPTGFIFCMPLYYVRYLIYNMYGKFHSSIEDVMVVIVW